MSDRYLLYIDFLGFTDLVERGTAIMDLYDIVDSLNVHRHPSFKTIVFSDTILVYYLDPIDTREWRRYALMYLCEFAQDLLHRLSGTSIFFRGYITEGQFVHESKTNLQAFFGKALIKAHQTEKDLNGCGLFMDEKIDADSDIFKTIPYSSGVRYVFLLTHLLALSRECGNSYPVDAIFIEARGLEYNIFNEISYLQKIHDLSVNHPNPRVRAKHLQTWSLMNQQIPQIIKALLARAFSPSAICAMDWSKAIDLNRSQAPESLK